MTIIGIALAIKEWVGVWMDGWVVIKDVLRIWFRTLRQSKHSVGGWVVWRLSCFKDCLQR